MNDWTNEFTLEFLEAYKSEPVLWNPKDDCYKDKKEVNNAWIRISESLNISVPILKRKKESLMATFRGHLRRKKNSIKSGANEIYKPIWFAYEYMESFLGVVYRCIPTVRTENNEENVNQLKDRDAENDDEDDISLPKKILKRRIHPELRSAERSVTEALGTLNKVLTNKKNEKEEDECDLYGRLLAKKLKKLSEQERLHVMYQIDGLFVGNSSSQAQMALSSPTSTTYQSQRPSIAFVSSDSSTNFEPITELKVEESEITENMY